MTMTTEELKREMYNRLANLKACLSPSHLAGNLFELSLEAYLEELRKETAGLSSDIRSAITNGNAMRDAYLHQVSLTMEAREEACRERNRVQTFEFANKSAGELLIQAQEKISRQRKIIKALCAHQEACDSESCAMDKDSKENDPEVKCGALAAKSEVVCDHKWGFPLSTQKITCGKCGMVRGEK